MPSIALVSGADSNYFPLLREWISSVRRCKESEGLDICVIDAGLTAEQISALKPEVKSIVSPEWPVGIPASKTKDMDRLKACVCRPFIREIFPGYDTYMWMDADTWVQDWAGAQMFLDAANLKKDRIAITNGADRAYPKSFRVKWLWRWPYRIANFYFSNGKAAYGFSVAKKLCTEYVMNAGCFALSAKAPHWDRWQKNIVAAAAKGKLFTAEQLSLGVTVYLDGCKAEMLPSYTHWICENAPFWDRQKGAFVEPFMPHMTLGVLHLVGVDALRASRKAEGKFQTTDGAFVALPLRYPHFDGGDLTTAKPKRG
ncbi:MAG: glycosyl transferase family 8 [Bdellovibrionales bacterium]